MISKDISVFFIFFSAFFLSSLSDPEPGWSQEAEEAIRSLDKQLQTEPRFQKALKDVSLPKGATAELTCLVDGRSMAATNLISPKIHFYLCNSSHLSN